MAELRSDRLRLFDAVLRRGGFSAAARALGVTQSSVSQAIASLEADVGQPLFDRSSRTLRLTEAGETLRAHVGSVLDALEATRAALQQLDEVTAGQLSLGATDTYATHLLPPVFAAFRKRYPAVELRLDNRPSPALAEKVAARELDLGVVSLPLPRASQAVEALTQVPLVAQRDVVIVPRRHPLASRAKVRLEELARHPLVLLDRSTASRAWLDRHFAAADLHPRVAMEMSSLEVLVKLVELEFGLSVVPAIAVKDARVVAVPLVGAERRMVGLVMPKSASRVAQAFAALCRELLRHG